MKKETGFTLIELLTVLLLTSVLLGLGAFAVRQFWLVRAFHGAQDEIVTQLRQLQEQVVAETHPNVFGARFPNGGVDQDTWGLIRYNPGPDGEQGGGDDICRETTTLQFGSGVQIQPGVGNTFFNEGPVADVIEACEASEDVNNFGGPDQFVFFFGRGTATDGQVTVRQTLLDDRRASVCVTAVTGRVSPC